MAKTMKIQEGNIVRDMTEAEIDAAMSVGVEPPPPLPPPPAPVPASISDRQFFQGLALQSVITQEEALAAVKTGELPALIAAYVAELPDAEKFSAQMLLSGATVFERAHPFTARFGLAMGWTDAQLDDFWRFCAAL